MTNILTDFHHSGLHRSLQLLFENRLGYNLYRQIGMDWYKNGFWAINEHEATAKQYLDIRGGQGMNPPDGTPNLNYSTEDSFLDGIYYCEDTHHRSVHRAIAFERFCQMKFDIIIASVPQHVPIFKRLIKEYQPQAKLVFQMGNMFSEITNNLHEIPNLLASTIAFPLPTTCNGVFYHQEFDTTVFSPSELPAEKLFTSFINVYQHNGGFTDYATLRTMLPEYEFKSYGGQCENGAVTGIENVAAIMKKSYFGFHSKYMGDGYGHVLYNWMACGKPIITRLSDYKGKLAEEILFDHETCLDIDRYSFEQLRDIISTLPDHQYEYMCQQAYSRFKTLVNFDFEEKLIRIWLDRLI